jgi:O-antigen/teichoic acid export membrane protein
MELKKIVKSTSYIVISKVIQFLVGIARSKIAAVIIGTTGVGIFSQVSYLVDMISNTTLLSMNDGLVKLIAQNKSEKGFKETLKGLMKSYSVLILISSIIAIILCIVFARPLTVFFLGDERYLIYFLIGISCLPVTISNSLSFALLKSHKETKLISRSTISASLITIAAFVPLIILFKTTGAVVSVIVNYSVLLIMNSYQARKHILTGLQVKFKQLFKARTERKYTRELLQFAIFGATSGFIMIIGESICRSIVVNRLGIDKMGIYSPITSWATLLTGFILPTFNIYLYPRYSECKSNIEIIGLYNDFNRLICFIMIPFLFLAIPFRNQIIPLFYSKNFIEASKYLPWHFIGLLFYMWWYPMALILTPTGRIKIYSIFIVMMSIVDILVVSFFVPRFGLYGWMLKFIVSPFLSFVFIFLYLRRTISFNIKWNNALLMSYTMFLPLLITIFFDHTYIRYFMAIFGVLIGILFLSKNEKKFILFKLKIVK